MVLGQIVHGQFVLPELEIVIVKEAVVLAWGLPESVTRAVRLNVPDAVGVPLILPVLPLSVSPPGSAPPEMDHV